MSMFILIALCIALGLNFIYPPSRIFFFFFINISVRAFFFHLKLKHDIYLVKISLVK